MNTLFLQLSVNGEQCRGWVETASGLAVLSEDQPASFAQRYPGHATVIFLPSSLCLFTTVTASARQLKQAGQSLAWLIEEQCGEDAENLQVIAAPVEGDDQTPLLGIGREALHDVLARLRQAGLRVVAVLPDLLLLVRGAEAGSWQVADNDDGTLTLRTAAFSGAVLENDLLELMLDAARQEYGAATLINASIRNVELAERLQSWMSLHQTQGEISREAADPVLALAEGRDWIKHPGNFLQGGFSSNQHFSLSPSLRTAALFMAAAFSLQLLSEWISYGYFHYQAGKAQAAATALYKQTWPEERRIVNLRRQLQAHLNENSGSGVALPVLTRIAESLQGSGLAAQRVDFSNGVFTLDVDARALGEIDSLRQRLDGQGFRTEIVSANAQSGLIRGRLRVEGGV